MAEIRDNFIKSLDDSQCGITYKMEKVYSTLKEKDVELYLKLVRSQVFLWVLGGMSVLLNCAWVEHRVCEGLCLWGSEILTCELKQPLLGVSPERADTARLPPLPASESKLWLLHSCKWESGGFWPRSLVTCIAGAGLFTLL